MSTSDRITDSDRYSRQILFAPIGAAGQERLGLSRVVVIGCGGLGTSLTEMVVRAGVGSLLVVDRDHVEPSNLQRQILFDEEDALESRPKASAAAAKLRRINSNVRIEAQVKDVHRGNIEELLAGADLVLDGVDNVETRFLVNDACLKHGIPWVYGACVAGQGICMPILPGETPCLRCVFESAPPPGSTPTCNTVGVVAPIVAITASLQVAEGLKILTGNRDAVCRVMRTVDVWNGQMRETDMEAYRTVDCPACGAGRFDYLEPDAPGGLPE